MDTADTTLDARAYSQYISLGDSYASGVGATTGPTDACSRSDLAWPNLLNDSLNFTATASAPIYAACTSARTWNLVETQLPVVQASPDRNNALITVTIGGNDVNVADELLKCLDPDQDCIPDETTISANIDTVAYPNLVNTFTALRNAAPTATIVAVGYPLLVAPSTDTDCDRTEAGKLLDGAKRDMIRRLVHQMNLRIAQAARAVPIFWITDEVESTFAGFEACARGRSDYINSNAPSLLWPLPLFHPSALGNQTYRDAVLTGLGNLTSNKPAPSPFTPATTLTPVSATTPVPAITPVPATTPVPAITPVPATTPAAAPRPATTPVPATTPTPAAAPRPATTPVPATTPTPAAAPRPATTPGTAPAPATSPAPKAIPTPAATPTPKPMPMPATATSSTTPTTGTPSTPTSSTMPEATSVTTGKSPSGSPDSSESSVSGTLCVPTESSDTPEATVTGTLCVPTTQSPSDSPDKANPNAPSMTQPGSDSDPAKDPGVDPVTGPAQYPGFDPNSGAAPDPGVDPVTGPAQYPGFDPNYDPAQYPQFDPNDPALFPVFDPNADPAPYYPEY